MSSMVALLLVVGLSPGAPPSKWEEGEWAKWQNMADGKGWWACVSFRGHGERSELSKSLYLEVDGSHLRSNIYDTVNPKNDEKNEAVVSLDPSASPKAINLKIKGNQLFNF